MYKFDPQGKTPADMLQPAMKASELQEVLQIVRVTGAPPSNTKNHDLLKVILALIGLVFTATVWAMSVACLITHI